jgi:hypothetical protein
MAGSYVKKRKVCLSVTGTEYGMFSDLSPKGKRAETI